MASTKIAYMPQDIIPPYYPEQTLRAPNVSTSSTRNGLWSAAPPATPQSSTTSTGTVWGSPLSVLPSGANVHSSTTSSFGRQFSSGSPELAPNSLAALTADSEPVLSVEERTGSVLAAAKAHSSTTSSRFSSRHNSQTDTVPPSPSNTSFQGYHSSGSAVSLSPSASSSMLVSNNDNLSHASTANTVQGSSSASANDEIINTAIVVKNIPFAIKKEQLIEFMVQLGIPLPYAFNYHFDNGVFRGLAFANFATAEETAEVISSLNGRELGGRKLRVEYKKMLPFQERERIEREKRERRGQLEEQHQQGTHRKQSSGLNSSSSPQLQPQQPSVQSQSQAAVPVASIHPGIQQSQGKARQSPILTQHQQPQSQVQHQAQQQPGSLLNAGASAYGAPLSKSTSSTFTSPSNAHQHQCPPVGVDMNVPENLQIYSTLLVFKRDYSKVELILPQSCMATLSSSQVHVLNTLCQHLDLQLYGSDEQGIVISKRSETSLFKGEQDNDYYSSGIFRNAVATPAPYHLTRVGMPAVSTAPSTNINSMNALNRWNGIGQGVGGAPVNFASK